MDRPKIICHILQSVDGNIDGDFFTLPELSPAYRAFSRIREEYACDAVISGATTAAEIYRGRFVDNLPTSSERLPRTDWKARQADRYAVVIDGTGSVRWESGSVERRGEKLHVIVVLQENASDAYISHLRKAGVSYIFAGRDSLDLPLTARKLKELFGIESMLLSGGGVVDWSFLQAGLIDEISLVVPPVIDGGVSLPSAFDDSPLAAGHAPVALKLTYLQRLEGDALWLRYVPT
jgi:riboflavin biosynthesis pyrimidine reductase